MRLRLRDTTALAAGSALSGLLAYVFFALATRHLGAADAAAVSVLWTYWSFAAAVLTFPLQHWIARTVAATASEAAVRNALPRLAGFVGVIALLSGAAAWTARELLFHRDDLWFPALVVAVTIGSGFIGVVRGGLAARHRFLGNAWVLVAENGSRCLAAAVLVVAGTGANVGFGVALAGGALVGLLWPSSVHFRRDAPGAERATPVVSPLAFLGGAAGGQLVGQAVLTGGPVVLALSGGTAVEVTVLFATLALFRAPYTLAIGLVSQVTGRLTALMVSGDLAALRRVRAVVVAATLLGAVAAGVVGYTAGPWLVRLVFGSSVVVTASVATAVAVGSAVALGNLVTTVTLMAQNRAHAVARAWLVGLAGGALAFVVLRGEAAMTSTVLAFLAAEGVAFLVLLAEEARGTSKIRRRLVPAAHRQ
jgi:O-antigen/teichoic acid export membrane protein